MSLLYFPSRKEPVIHIHKCDGCGAHVDIHHHNGMPLPCDEDDRRELCAYCLDNEYEGTPEYTPANCGVELV